jgi:CRISPR/Cas system-associated endoribonuclease Cas2
MKTASQRDTDNQKLTASSPAHAVPVYVAYDISQCRRRNRLHRLLHGFGEPVQESLFLCWLDAVRQRRLRVLLDDFQRAPHSGQERVHCIAARMGTEAAPASEWICE